MTIKDYILTAELKNATTRLEGLINLNAPAIVIQGQQKLVSDLEKGVLVVSGDVEYLDAPYSNHEVKTGRGGKIYVSFNDNSINYFPQAKFGRCIYCSK